MIRSWGSINDMKTFQVHLAASTLITFSSVIFFSCPITIRLGERELSVFLCLLLFQVIIDNLLNLELLLWSAQQPGGQSPWAQMAVSHTSRTSEYTTFTPSLLCPLLCSSNITDAGHSGHTPTQTVAIYLTKLFFVHALFPTLFPTTLVVEWWIRPDNSTFHLVIFDPSTGAVVNRSGTPQVCIFLPIYMHACIHGCDDLFHFLIFQQGYSVNSTWARGQAWGIYGVPFCSPYIYLFVLLNHCFFLSCFSSFLFSFLSY